MQTRTHSAAAAPTAVADAKLLTRHSALATFNFMWAFDPHDTIVAIASPPASGLRGIVRLSGPSAIAIASRRFEPSHTNAEPPRRATYTRGRLTLDELCAPIACSLATWPTRRSFTAEPAAELHLSGSAPILQSALADCLSAGARMANPGEFTLRAFLNGRIDLTQAEAVLGVINANNEAQLDAALQQLAGGIRTQIDALRNALLDVVAELEAGLDFAEEPDVIAKRDHRILRLIDAATHTLDTLVSKLHSRDHAAHQPRVVLVGPPNAGKSSLFNALAGSDSAIVSDQAGTTRDYLNARVTCDGIEIRLVDTAGIEVHHDPIAAVAQANRVAQTATADLLVVCQSADAYWDGATRNQLPPIPRIDVWTKSDISPPKHTNALPTSVHRSFNINELKSLIATHLLTSHNSDSAPSSTSARCRADLIDARIAIARAGEAMRENVGDEFASLELRTAITSLGSVTGATFSDEILTRIFARFCIGK